MVDHSDIRGLDTAWLVFVVELPMSKVEGQPVRRRLIFLSRVLPTGCYPGQNAHLSDQCPQSFRLPALLLLWETSVFPAVAFLLLWTVAEALSNDTMIKTIVIIALVNPLAVFIPFASSLDFVIFHMVYFSALANSKNKTPDGISIFAIAPNRQPRYGCRDDFDMQEIELSRWNFETTIDDFRYVRHEVA